MYRSTIEKHLSATKILKKLLVLPLALGTTLLFAQVKTPAKVVQKKQVVTKKSNDSIPVPPKPTTKYTDNIDDRMKGPNGEKIYIGPNGGRYYLNGTKKVYVLYGNKKKKA